MGIVQRVSRRTGYTFRIALLSVLGGQVASFYGFFYLYALSSLKTDGSFIRTLPSLVGPTLILALAFVSAVHYVGFGFLRLFGLRWELKRLRIINDHVRGKEIENDLSREALAGLLRALSRFPVLNTVTAGVLGLTLFLCVLARVLLAYGSSGSLVAAGLQAGVVSLLIYLYVTYLITDFLSTSARAQVKQALHRVGGRIREEYLFSLKGKFVSFFVFLLTTLLVIYSFILVRGAQAPDPKAMTAFTALSILISCFVVILYFTSIYQSLKEARAASEELASGGSGYVFSGSLDREFSDLNRSMIGAAEEVNRYRNKMERLVRQKTLALERSLAELHDSEKRFRSMVENGSDVITILNADGTRRYISPSVERMLGYSPEESARMHPFDQIHPEDLPGARLAFQALQEKPESTLSLTFRTRHKSGAWRTMETIGKNLLHNPAVGGLVITSRDITESRLAAEEQEKSLSLLRATLESTADGILVVNQEGKIESYNQEFCRMWRIPEELLEERRDDQVLDFVLEQLKDPEAFIGKVRALYAEADSESFDVLEFRDGRTFERYSKPQKIGERAVGRVWNFRDVTERKDAEAQLRAYQEKLQELVDEKTRELKQEIAERKRAEQEVRTLNEELEERVKARTEDLQKAYEELKLLDAMKDSFLSSVSHELRTPLTSIRSFSEILLNYDEEDIATRKEFLGIILTETERLTRLINDFLDLSKIEAGKMVYNDEFVMLGEIIQEAIRSQTHAIREKDLRVTLDVPGDIPSVFVDRDRIYQVVMNLMGNAIKFSHRGKEILVRVRGFSGKRTGEAPAWVRVSITDQGIGINESDFQIIFDKFSQVASDTMKDKPQGTGLGLPICKEIVTHYGGNIWVESRRGQGSTFSFTLPAFARPQERDEPASTTEGKPARPENDAPSSEEPAREKRHGSAA